MGKYGITFLISSIVLIISATFAADCDYPDVYFGISLLIAIFSALVCLLCFGVVVSDYDFLTGKSLKEEETKPQPIMQQNRKQTTQSKQQDQQFFGYYVYLANIKDTDEYKIEITTNIVVTTNYHKNYIPNFQIIAKKHFQTHSEAQSYQKCVKTHFGNKQEISGGWFNLTKDELEEIERNFFYNEYYWKVEHHNQQTEQEKANTSYQYEQYKQDEVKQKPQPKPYYVYLMGDGRSYKIGISNNVQRRLKDFQTGNPYIKIITYKKFINQKEAQKIETMLHQQYAHCNVGLEWFNPTDDELTTIKALLS